MKNYLMPLGLLSLCLVNSCAFIRALAFNAENLHGCILEAKNNKLVCSTNKKSVFLEKNGIAMNSHSCLKSESAISATKCEPIRGDTCIINNSKAFCSNGKKELSEINGWLCFETGELEALIGNCKIRVKK